MYERKCDYNSMGDAKSWSLTEMADRYYRHKKSDGCSPSFLSSVKRHIQYFMIWLKKQGFDNIEVRFEATAEPPYKISVKEPMAQAIIAAANKIFGKPPIVNGVSAEGTILKHVWIPCVLTGFANPGANLHAPNENIKVGHYIKGIKYAAQIMEEFGKQS